MGDLCGYRDFLGVAHFQLQEWGVWQVGGMEETLRAQSQGGRVKTGMSVMVREPADQTRDR